MDAVRDWQQETCGMTKCDVEEGNGSAEVVECKLFAGSSAVNNSSSEYIGYRNS
jgi:hypothetical protein